METPTAVAERSYAEMVLESMSSARDSVHKAIEHYEEQRRDLVTRHRDALTVVDDHLKTLRGAVAEARVMKKRRAPRVAGQEPVWKRLEAVIRQDGPMTVATAASRIGAVNAAVNAEARRRADIFVVTNTDDGITVALNG